jgi:hypothetical protein
MPDNSARGLLHLHSGSEKSQNLKNFYRKGAKGEKGNTLFCVVSLPSAPYSPLRLFSFSILSEFCGLDLDAVKDHAAGLLFDGGPARYGA